MRRAEARLPLEHAVALGLLHGPAELLPISSSAHTALVPWLLGWPYVRLDGELRKSFEVALHTGTGVALAISMRAELRRSLARADGRRARVLALALAPPTLAGYLLEGPIERRLGGPRSIAAGLVAGAMAMALTDIRASRHAAGERASEDASAVDGLALGLAQALALVPGVSRNGATLGAARARGFSRAAAQALSWEAGLPLVLGASVRRGLALCRSGIRGGHCGVLGAGGGAAFVSTLVSARALRRGTREGRPLLAYSVYRCLLAALVIARGRAQ
ncbi:MAG: undecaprenyl-diphosphate phosphatase [Solirubrobacteraceae bacterium]